MHRYDIDGVFVAVEYDYGDAAAGNSGEYGEYRSVLFGELGRELYFDGKCGGGGGEFCGLERDG